MITNRITASTETLLDQAGATAGIFLRAAIREIDESLGDGYAIKNPALVAQITRIAAEDFNTAIRVQAQQDAIAASRKEPWDV